MPLLAKCNITNMSFPGCTSDNNGVFVSVIVPTRHPKQHPMFQKTLKDLKTGKELNIFATYNSRIACMNEYSPTGIYFTGKLSEYGEVILDIEDENNIRNLGRFVELTQYEYNDGMHEYQASNAYKLYTLGEYSACWSLISSVMKYFDHDSIFMDSNFGPLPIAFSLIRKDALDKMLSETFQKRVFKYQYRFNNLSLDERMDKSHDVFQNLKSKKRKYDMPFDYIGRGISRDNDYLDESNNVFSNNVRNIITDLAFNRILFKIEYEKEEDLILLIKDIIFTDYIVSCFEMLQTEFRRANTVSMEDYLNDDTYKAFKFNESLYEQDQLSQENYDGYEFLIDEIAEFTSNETRYYASYFDSDESIEKMVERFGEIPEDLTNEHDSNGVLVYDCLLKKYSILEDHDLVENYKLVEK